MIWLAIITICILATKVVLATVLPSARRRADVEGPFPGAALPALDEMNAYRPVPAPVRVRADEIPHLWENLREET